MNTTLTSKTANLAKTSRQGNITNPFKFSNFEGNTLQFADVFEGFEPKKQNKLRMIASSVTGSMNKMRSSITEPIMNFVNRVRGGISNAWDYAKNTNVSDLPGVKQVSEVLNTPINLNINLDGIKNIGRSISSGLNTDVKDIGKGISSKMEFLNSDVTELWSGLVSRIHTNRYSSEMSVADLESAWKSEIANEVAEVA
ncbi:MAG: hypothetical protein NC334_04855 [Bacteroides sp.]|nr:hypothetical protein [Bacteroides sp.]